MSQAKATIEDVAKAAGVSRQTVSRVINRASNVSDKTRNQVEQAIATLGYVPNLAARRMGGGRSYTLLVLMEADNEAAARALPLGEMLLAGIETCSQSNYHLMFDRLALAAPDSGTEDGIAAQLTAILAAVQPDGVIVLPPIDENKGLHGLLASRGVPTACLGERTELGRNVPGLDQSAFGEEAARLLIELGHRQIGYIAGPADLPRSQARIEGYRRALARAGSRAHRHFVAEAPVDFRASLELARNWLAPTIRPTAIIADTAQDALALHQVAGEFGIAIPRGLSLLSLEEPPNPVLLKPALSSLHLPLEKMFSNACERLIAAQGGEQETSPIPGAVLTKRASMAKAPRTV